MATFLWRYGGAFTLCFFAEEELVTDCTHTFSDVPAGTYFDVGVAWMSHYGITTGTSATTFSPYEVLTRAQAVTFLQRYDNRFR